MHPQVQVEHRHVRPDVADLLLSCAPHFLDIVKVLLDRRAVGKRLDDLAWRSFRLGAKEELAAVIFLDDHHPNDASCRPPRGQKGFDGLGDELTIDEALHLLPTRTMSGAALQRNALATIPWRL